MAKIVNFIFQVEEWSSEDSAKEVYSETMSNLVKFVVEATSRPGVKNVG
jgi:hypothetical protein